MGVQLTYSFSCM